MHGIDHLGVVIIAESDGMGGEHPTQIHAAGCTADRASGGRRRACRLDVS